MLDPVQEGGREGRRESDRGGVGTRGREGGKEGGREGREGGGREKEREGGRRGNREEVVQCKDDGSIMHRYLCKNIGW